MKTAKPFSGHRKPQWVPTLLEVKIAICGLMMQFPILLVKGRHLGSQIGEFDAYYLGMCQGQCTVHALDLKPLLIINHIEKWGKPAQKGFRPPSVMKGIGYFQNLKEFLRNVLKFFGNFLDFF